MSQLTKPIFCIAAVARNGVIGANGRLPWHLPLEFKWFLQQTKGGVVVLGPLCYAELGVALPDRGTVVVSRRAATKGLFPGAEAAADLPSAIALAEAMEWQGPIWICGGERIYAEGLALCSKLYISRIEQDFTGDKVFPASWPTEFTHCVASQRQQEEGVTYTSEIWAR